MTNKTEWEGRIVDADREAAAKIAGSGPLNYPIAKVIAHYRIEATTALEAERDALREALENLEASYSALCEMTGKDFHKGPLSHATHARQVLAASKKSE